MSVPSPSLFGRATRISEGLHLEDTAEIPWPLPFLHPSPTYEVIPSRIRWFSLLDESLPSPFLSRINIMAAPLTDIPEPGAAATDVGLVVSPAIPCSPDALARFEFESGPGKLGTKLLMVEWSTASEPVADVATAKPAPSPDHQEEHWEVSWPGKMKRYYAQSERNGAATQRVYFLLPQNAPVPGFVTITQLPAGRTLHTRPLPAFYTPELGVDPARDGGKKGVLHTIWCVS